MQQFLRWLRLCISYCLFAIFVFSAWYKQTTIYLIYQGAGQLSILFNRMSIDQYSSRSGLSKIEKQNILLIEEIKKYSVDSLGYLPTNNFTTIYDQKKSPVLWVITASAPYELKPFEWEFPVVGRVSYKGFFKKELAEKERNKLRCLGYDVDLRSVSAWSTLGWFNDPILSGMLARGKGALCNLLFHELFHATYYAPDNVNFNENIASFIAHKATLLFLKNDSVSYHQYVQSCSDNVLVSNFMQRQNQFIRKFYKETGDHPKKYLLKLKAVNMIADSVMTLGLKQKGRAEHHRNEILEQKNACFIDYEQYDSMQDSLERVFNKFYKGDLKKLVQDLKQNQTIIKFDN
jgi:hypothetical protein